MRPRAIAVLAAIVWLICASPAAAHWSVLATPKPAGRFSGLVSVSCAAPTACTAVGGTGRTSSRGLAERWNGARWSIQPTPAPTAKRPALGGLEAVSCPSITACTATGQLASRAVANSWDGLRWTAERTADPGRGVNLLGVSCPSSAACVAVGGANRASAVAERWDGSRWSRQRTPTAIPGHERSLSDVSCPGASTCIAVGDTYRRGDQRTLSERWDGTRWSILRTPAPGPGDGSQLDRVSCVSIADCVAVGSSSTPSPSRQLPLAEHWNGSRWMVQRTPRPPGADLTVLSGVSCVSAHACAAVGVYRVGKRPERTLAERWDGRRWSIQQTPNPPRGRERQLFGVSCVSAARCLAVGDFRNRAGALVPLAERSAP